MQNPLNLHLPQVLQSHQGAHHRASVFYLSLFGLILYQEVWLFALARYLIFKSASLSKTSLYNGLILSLKSLIMASLFLQFLFPHYTVPKRGKVLYLLKNYHF